MTSRLAEALAVRVFPVLRTLLRLCGLRLGVLRQYRPRPLACPALRLRAAGRAASRISIVTPSLNQGLYLERTIASVWSQDYPHREHIVQDGGSEDDTLSILRRNGQRVTEWRSAPDAGQAHAINLGFARSTGEIMAYLNSDDVLMRGALAFVAHFLHDHPEVDVVYSHRIVIDEADREIGRWILPQHDAGALLWIDYVPQETVFWRRRIWERSGSRIDESFHYALDWDLLVRFQRAGARFARLPTFLAAFRCHPAQKTLALRHVGIREVNRIRGAQHGAAVSQWNVAKAAGPYLARHILLQDAYACRQALVGLVDGALAGARRSPAGGGRKQGEG